MRKSRPWFEVYGRSTKVQNGSVQTTHKRDASQAQCAAKYERPTLDTKRTYDSHGLLETSRLTLPSDRN